MKILFGGKESYLKKFKTSARVRSQEFQNLGQLFHEKEPPDPFFNNNKIMTLNMTFATAKY